MPAGALQCLPGDGRDAGQALVEDTHVALIAFTGSRAVGTTMYETVLRTVTEDDRPRAVVAEMGGKNPALVFDDADLDEAVTEVLASTFGHANQKCSALSRVLVTRSIAERFTARLVDAASSLVCGAAEDPATQVNPIIDRRASERLREAAARARTEGRVLLDRFEAPAGTLVHGPLIVAIDAVHALTARTMTEELFGPILAVVAVEDEDEALRIANGTGYALTSALFSRSPRCIERVSAAIEAGHVYVNRSSTGARPGVEPFGGMRFSGTGPKAGGSDYLWAFFDRTDAPHDDTLGSPEDTATIDASVRLDGPARWDVPLHERLEAIERAALSIAATDVVTARAILEVATQAAVEIGRPSPPTQVAGQETQVRYDVPRGLGLVHATGDDAARWLIAPLINGNAVLLVGSPSLATLVAALHEAGVPRVVLRAVDGDTHHFVRLAREAAVAFVGCDRGPFRALAAATGVVHDEQLGLRALLSPLDGPQPHESGFVSRFAWPRVIASRTLRHGANLPFATIAPAAGLDER